MSFQLNSFCANKGSILGKPFFSVKFEVKLSKDDKGCWLVMVGATNHMHLYFQKCIPSSFGKSGFCISAGYTRRLWEMKKNIMEKENMWYLWSPQYCYFTVINYRLVQSYNSPQIYKSHKADELMPLYFISWYKKSGKLLFLKKHKRSVGVAKGQQSNPPIYLF